MDSSSGIPRPGVLVAADHSRRVGVVAPVDRYCGPLYRPDVASPPGSPTFLCFDVGLTNVKAVLFADDGSIVASASRAYPTVFGSATEAEQDPAEWWRAIRASAAEVAVGGGRRWADVSGVAVTAHMHGLVGLDAMGEPVGRALILGDRRAASEADHMTRTLGDERIHVITGSTMDATMPAAKISWIRTHDPGRFEAIMLFTSVKDYLRGRLADGDRSMEPIDACATAMWDIHRNEWSGEILESVGTTWGSRSAPTPSPSSSARCSSCPSSGATWAWT